MSLRNRWLRVVSAIAIASLVALDAQAHDFWLQPSVFQAMPGQSVELRMLIGDPGAVEHWETEWRKVVSLQDFAPTAVHDLLAALHPLNGTKPELTRVDATVTLAGEGTHILAFASNQQLSELPAEQFTSYALHEGLALPLAGRKANGKTKAAGRELYSRRAKALVQVGAQATDTVSQPIGQTLEIVPERNPYLVKPGEPLRVVVRFHGSPLPGASVVLESLGAGATHGTPALTDSRGSASWPLPSKGDWKVNVVWSYPINDPRADNETVFCSLTFGTRAN